jgi:hypothetical protein
MSSDDSKRQGSAGFTHAGIGALMTFKCDDCRQIRTTGGRKKTRIGWRCVGCVRAKAEKVAA